MKKQTIIELASLTGLLIMLILSMNRIMDMVEMHTRCCSEPLYTSFWDKHAEQLFFLLLVLVIVVSYFIINRILYIKRWKRSDKREK